MVEGAYPIGLVEQVATLTKFVEFTAAIVEFEPTELANFRLLMPVPLSFPCLSVSVHLLFLSEAPECLSRPSVLPLVSPSKTSVDREATSTATTIFYLL